VELNDGIRRSQLRLVQLRDADDELQVKCTVTYTSSTANNVFGGELAGDPITLNIGQITSFTASSTDIIKDNEVTLTCKATAETAPTFSFVTRDDQLDFSLFEVVSTGAVTQQGGDDVFSQEITLKSLVARTTGQKVYCKVDYGASAGETTKEITITTYFDCTKATFKTPANIVVTKTTSDDGTTITQTATCSESYYYFISEDTEYVAQSITCTKQTGRYDKQLMPCSTVTMYSEKSLSTTMDVSSENYKICQDTTTKDYEQYSKTEIEKILRSKSDKCGYYPVSPCLADGATESCTLVEDGTTCEYDADADELIMTLKVSFGGAEYTGEKANELMKPTGKVRFWSCDAKKRKRSVLDELQELSDLPINATYTDTQTDEPSDRNVVVAGTAASCSVALVAFLSYLFIFRRKRATETPDVVEDQLLA